MGVKSVSVPIMMLHIGGRKSVTKEGMKRETLMCFLVGFYNSNAVSCHYIQDKPYHFEEAPALHEHLIKFHFLDTDVLYDVSLQREPRYAK